MTVACVSVIGGTALQNCIQSIAETGLSGIVVADPASITAETESIIRRYCIQVLDGAGCSIPVRRALAARHAKSEWIALIEDTCTLDEAWRSGCEAIMTTDGAIAASGPVNLGKPLRTRAKALYCSDYGPFFPASPDARNASNHSGLSTANTLPGVNLLYRSASVLTYLDDEGLIESEIHQRMREDGHQLHLHEDLSVTLRYADATGASCRSRFTHGRLYGGLQARKLGPGARLTRGLACFLLPLVLSFRSIRALAGTREPFATTAAWILIFETLWSVGEFTGYILGCGDTLAEWQ